MISFENVSFSYAATPAENSLDDITLTVNDGECVLLTGPSGCGKSTLLRLLNGMIPEFYDGERRGTIRIGGREISDRGIYDFVGEIGTVFQNPRSQFFNVDTTSELAFGCENLALPEKEILARMEKTVECFHIENLMDRSIFELSGGEKQKIACGSVDVLAPDIILLDEPSANLDFESTNGLRDVIRAWKQSGKTVLIAEHRINYLWELADKVVILRDGRIEWVLDRKEKEAFTEEMCAGYGLRSMAAISPIDLADDLGYGQIEKENAVVLKDFRYAYADKKEFLHVDEMLIPKGKVTAIVGANGAGKTTFLECICGIRKNHGVLIDRGRSYKTKQRTGRIFMVMQDANHQLFTESVLDEVLISMQDEDEERAREILDGVGLLALADRHPMSLSGGQKQRLAIACGAASGSEILLLDEPTSGLDLINMRAVAGILNRLKAEGRTLLIVTHDSEFIECVCDGVIRMGEVG